MTPINTLIDALQNSELFKDLEAGQLEKMANLCRGCSYRKGEMIFMEGDEAKELYVLVEGRVALEMDVCPVPGRPSIPTAVEVASDGEILGWSALVEPYEYTLSGRCLTHCRVLAINGEMLREIVAEDVNLGYELMRRLTKIIAMRLQYTRLRLTSGLGLVLLGKDLKASR